MHLSTFFIEPRVESALCQLDMLSEYVNWLFLDTFWNPDAKNVFVLAFQHLEVDSPFFCAQFFFVLQSEVKAQILENELKVRGILIIFVV